MSGRLEGRACLIVGGTSGIGLASARRFLEEGARVAVAGLTPLSDEARRELGALGPVREFGADVRFIGQVVELFGAAWEYLGRRLDVLVHTAGISGRKFGDGPLHECSDDAWDRVIEANLGSVFRTNREAVQTMLGQAPDDQGLRGSIVNLGSVLSHAPAPEYFGTTAYAASKGAIRALTLAAAARYARDGIRLNLIEPGLIETPMAARAVGDPAIRAYLATKQPMGRGPGRAADVAEAAVYLAEPAARFVTGVVLTVDGGWSISDGQRPREEPS